MDIRPKVSIVVPIYKVEKYLRRSLDSLINQTLQEIEIICINDGSPDKSIDILNEYKEKYVDKKIIVIDKKNEGVWKARFDGIKKAEGEYIAFCDPDDYVALDFAEKMYNAAKQNESDIVVSGFYRIDDVTEHVYSTEMTGLSKRKINMEKNPEEVISVNTALWNKIYKAEILKNIKDIENPPKILEDMMFLLLVYVNIESITFIDDALYYYMVRENSAMSLMKKEQIESTEKAMLEVKKIYMSDEKGKKRIEVMDSMAFLHFGISLMLKVSEDKENFKTELKENEKFLDNEFSTWRKTEYLKLLYCIMHKSRNLKVAIMKKIYVMHLLRAFLAVYKFIIEKCKIDIKW